MTFEQWANDRGLTYQEKLICGNMWDIAQAEQQPLIEDLGRKIHTLRESRDSCCEQYKESANRIGRLEYLLKGILNALPVNKDWLDPDLERLARQSLKGTD